MNEQELQRRIQELKSLAHSKNIDISHEIGRLSSKLSGGHAEDVPDAWTRVELARHADRPGTLQYISHMSERFMEFHGDRAFGDDAAMVGGICSIEGQYFTFIGHQKGRNMKENITRNYGMAHPEGYRKALRLAKQAEKFRRPIITLIDTSGAYPGLSSEERGISEAIARNLKEFSVLRTPVICVIIGEGGSGGAIGIGVGDRMFMLENAVYSVISPEGFASILLRDPKKGREAAALMKMTAFDLRAGGVVDGIIPEAPGGAHTDTAYTAQQIKKQILESYKELSKKRIDVLLRERSDSIRRLGAHIDTASKKAGLIERLFGK